MSTSDRVQALQRHFSLESFRSWQVDAIEALLDGSRRVLVVAPTGGGKSLCYQYPATELQGTSIVVSPLIALMEDQVRGLEKVGIPATWLSSTIEASERRRRIGKMMRGDYKLVYLAPERLTKGGMANLIEQLAPPLIAIDEAHCVSQWGHDFRPDYLEIRAFLERLRPRHILACTATATPIVREEIVELLGLRAEQTKVVLRGFARPNLHLSVEEIDAPSRRRLVMLRMLERQLGSPTKPRGGAIVYAATRKNSERVAREVLEQGFRAAAYHAGLEPERRASINARFASGDLDVVVATNAFGMGIDRPDIRAVIHVHAPGSIEEYYQEVGRAGRDGQPAEGLLIASSSDFGLRRRLIEGASGPEQFRPSPDRIQQQWRLFLDLMRYVEAGSCRHDFILRYFGDESETLGGCGHCDVCELLDERGDGGLEQSDRSEDVITVKKALSGVARAHGRVGLGTIADMLAGASTQQQRRLGFTELTTHGLLAEHPRPWIHALLRRLVTAGYVDITGDEYPLALLTPEGAAAMKGSSPIKLLLPPEGAGRNESKTRTKKKKKSSVAVAALTETDLALFEELRSLRREMAQGKGVPPYVVCHDRTLAEIATMRPTTLAELADVHGMGPARLDAYGSELIEVVAKGS